MADRDALERKLDLLIALTRVGVAAELERQRNALAADDASRAILELTTDSLGAGALKDGVRSRTGQSKATIERRIAELVSRGALVREGAGSSVSYRNSGLFEV